MHEKNIGGWIETDGLRREHESEMSQSHQIRITLNDMHKFSLSVACNCNSHDASEACEADSWDLENLSYFDLEDKLVEFL